MAKRDKQTRAALLNFSIWLDLQRLMKKPKDKDGRTHEDLVKEFLGE